MKLQLPTTYTIIFLLIILVAILTWFLPSGQFDRVLDHASGKEIVVAGTYKHISAHPQGIMDVLTSFCRGIIDGIDVIAYVLIVGGAYGVLLKTKAIDVAFQTLICKLGSRSILLIPVAMILFSMAGSATGFWEETLPFYIIMVPLMVSAGYDAIVGASILLLGSGSGIVASVINPFSTGISSVIASSQIKDGIDYRILSWFVCVSISIIYVLIYAYRVKKDPTKSYVYGVKDSKVDPLDKSKLLKFDRPKQIITILFVIMVGFMVYGVIALDWWIPHITMLFLTLSVIAAFLSKSNDKQYWSDFLEGSKEFLGVALIIGLARGVLVVANDGAIVDTVLNSMANSFSVLSKYQFIVANELVQIAIAMFIPSSSAQSALTMPIMISLADIFHINREVMVTALNYGTGLGNLITPTSGVLMGALTLSKIPLNKWLRFIIPLIIIQIIATSVILILSSR